MEYNSDLGFLASGGNDNIVNVYDIRKSTLVKSYGHSAAIKGLAWYPHRRGTLLSGGGFNDKTLRMVDTISDRLVKHKQLQSQITGILCSPEDENILSIHGYPSNNMTLWDGCDLSKIINFEGHNQRILYYGQSPDKSKVVTASSDETIKIWKCFKSEGVFTRAPANIFKFPVIR